MPSAVVLHVYDVSTEGAVQKVNQYLTAVGTGAFHGGLEVNGKEWSYGYSDSGSGVFSCPPKGCTAHHFRESHPIGEINLSETEVAKVIEKMQTDWPGSEYDLLRHNCVIFCNELSKALGAGPIPEWLTNLAGAGATICDGAIMAVNKTQAAAIIAKAKAGEIDEKYNIKGTAQVKAAEFLTAMQGIDKKYNVRENATDIAGKAVVKGGELATQAATKAQELDAQYKIRENAATMASQAAAKSGDLASQAAAKATQLNDQYHIMDQASGLASQAASQAGALNEKYDILGKAGDLKNKAAEQATTLGRKAGVVVEGNEVKTPVCFGLC